MLCASPQCIVHKITSLYQQQHSMHDHKLWWISYEINDLIEV